MTLIKATQCYNLNNAIVVKLMRLKVVRFNKAYLTLLSKAISDEFTLPMLLEWNNNLSSFIINNKYTINCVLDSINERTMIDKNDYEFVYQTVKEFLEWRLSIALGKYNPIFTKGEENAIDELTGINYYVDVSSLCSISDIYNDANYIYNLFKEITNDIFNQISRKEI